jgi:hypothetical protein
VKLPCVPLCEQVVSACLTVCDTTHSAFLGSGRNQNAVDARGLCVLLLRKHTAMSYPDIARAIGRTNHSTIITMKQRVEREAAQEPERWTGMVDRAEAEIVRLIPREAVEADRMRLNSADRALDDLRRIHYETETRLQQKILRERDRLGIKESA